jgi:SPP1 gp7 family putative phage head morphogenesis protein
MANDPTAIALQNLVTLRRLSNGLAREMRSEVRGLIDDYVAAIAKLDPTSVARDRYRRARVEKVLKEINSLNAERYPQIRRVLEDTTARIGAQQAAWATNSLQRTIGSVRVSTTAGLGVSYFRNIMKTDPFDGDTLKMWVKRHEAATVNAVRQQLQLGMAQSETLGDIVRRIRGRSAGGGRFTGGVLATSTKQAEGIARTAITHVANRGHLAVYEENADVLKGVEFTATLDSRTTEICARWDGTVWAVDDPKKQVPPLHYNCRSVLVPAVDWEGLGITPPDEGTRASMGGQVPSSTTYEQWFGNQSAQMQNSIIGVTRAQLFRNGQITFRDMIGKDNRVLTLAELPDLPVAAQTAATAVPTTLTMQAQEDWAVERFKGAQVSFKDIEPVVAREINTVLDAADRRGWVLPVGSIKPYARKKDPFMMATGDTSNTLFVGTTGQKTARMQAQWDLINEKQPDYIIAARVPRDKMAEAVLWHETGHLIDYKLAKIAGGRWDGTYTDRNPLALLGATASQQKTARELQKRFKTIYKKAVTDIHKGRPVMTNYGKTKVAEGWAELLSAYELKLPLPKYVVEYFDDALKFVASVDNATLVRISK